MLKVDLIGLFRRMMSSPNTPVAAWKTRARTGPNSRTHARRGKNIIEELLLFPATLIETETDSETRPNMMRDNIPTQ